jgi:hypothetical protein
MSSQSVQAQPKSAPPSPLVANQHSLAMLPRRAAEHGIEAPYAVCYYACLDGKLPWLFQKRGRRYWLDEDLDALLTALKGIASKPGTRGRQARVRASTSLAIS